MNVSFVRKSSLIAIIVALCAGIGAHETSAVPQEPADVEQGTEVLTRGPVHEAFAETVSYDPQPGLIVSQTPPEPIEELPPGHKPAGANVAWIPGYWAWDDEREDYLWVSGIWRSLPPRREWVPGYWATMQQGYQWTSGYWADASDSDVDYLPVPPATAEAGPNIAQPSPDYNWLPGCWIWQENRYVWRPGYWTVGQQGWDWVPAHYVWTPRGYVFVNGYWDYSVDRRGVLFSPVYFNPNVYEREGFSYSPSVVINLAGFSNHLFLRPSYGHYYFGDYYGSNYSTNGYYPWFAYHSSGRGYDPFYSHQRWNNRRNKGWANQVETDFNNRRDHDDRRPPRTWKAQQGRIKDGRPTDRNNEVATPYDEVVKRTENRERFRSVDQAERRQVLQRGRDIRTFRAERQKLESDASPKTESRKVKRPRSPVMGKPTEQLGKDNALPPRQNAPALDPKVEPKPKSERPRTTKPRNPKKVEPQEKPKSQPTAKPKEESSGKPRGTTKDKPQSTPKSKPSDKPKDKSKDKK